MPDWASNWAMSGGGKYSAHAKTFNTCARSAAPAAPIEAQHSALQTPSHSPFEASKYPPDSAAPAAVRFRRQDLAAHFAETDPGGSGLCAPGAKDHRIPVLQKHALLGRADANRLLSTQAQFQQRAGLLGCRSR